MFVYIIYMPSLQFSWIDQKISILSFVQGFERKYLKCSAKFTYLIVLDSIQHYPRNIVAENSRALLNLYMRLVLWVQMHSLLQTITDTTPHSYDCELIQVFWPARSSVNILAHSYSKVALRNSRVHCATNRRNFLFLKKLGL